MNRCSIERIASSLNLSIRELESRPAPESDLEEMNDADAVAHLKTRQKRELQHRIASGQVIEQRRLIRGLRQRLEVNVLPKIKVKLIAELKDAKDKLTNLKQRERQLRA